MTPLLVCRAVPADLPAIIAPLADDPFGARRDDPGLPLDPRYAAAFDAIAADPNRFLAAAIIDGAVVGNLHLTFVPGLARRGAWHADIKAVRIASARRDEGPGRQLLVWAVEQSRARGCGLVQLATDKSRTDAHRFYKRAGFTASHAGYRLALD